MTTLLEPPPIPAWGLRRDETTPRLPFSATLPAENLTERHRPRTLADVVGQGEAVFALQTYLDAPYPVAFLFEGPTGVGKTSAARALAADLGLSLDSVDYFEIDSGRQDGEAVDRIIDLFRYPPMFGGYRVVVVNEADLMTPKAAHLWLSGLESIPQRTVIVFTTNFPGKFPDRFLDRCERIAFASDARTLRQDAQALINSVWQKETQSMDDVPSVDDLPNVVDGGKSILSFRRVVAALGPLLRAKRSPMPDGRPTVAYAATPPVATPAPAATATVALPAPPATAPAKPARTPRKRGPAPVPASPTLSIGTGRAVRDLDRITEAAQAERERLEELTEANAQRARELREDIEILGDRDTAEHRAELRAVEDENAKLLKAWMAEGAKLATARKAAHPGK